jgi:hypothetical protein
MDSPDGSLGFYQCVRQRTRSKWLFAVCLTKVVVICPSRRFRIFQSCLKECETLGLWADIKGWLAERRF